MDALMEAARFAGLMLAVGIVAVAGLALVITWWRGRR